MPDYKVYIIGRVYTLGVTAENSDSAREKAFEDPDFAWTYDSRAEYDSVLGIRVKELPEMPEEDKK